MTYTHVSTPRTAVVAGAGAVALLTAVLAVPSADAAAGQPPDPPSATMAALRAEEIRSSLGGEEAGSFYDAENRKLVVNVTSEAAAAKVRAAGAQARIVKYSLASLDAARATLKEQAGIPGTSWAMDPRINKVVVVADPTVKGKHLDRLRTAAASLGERATLTHSPYELRPVIAGGDAIWGSQARCSLGFNVVKDGQPYVLTAGHCAKAVQRWSEQMGGSEIAVTEHHKFPGSDFGLAKYTAADVVHPSAVNLYSSGHSKSSGGGNGSGNQQPISKAADPIVGQKVQRSGSTTHVRGGEVTALNVTANYQEGAVEGLIQTTVCAEPGDSGGPLFDGDTALGLTSGGRGTCSQKGETFYQPVRAALEKTGAKLG
ncbi:S1 family peptidase [Streptomyces sp. NPDC001339]|uniref:S1 family peptidase n=1 Tax=Streptomyces sp. NPDC001339 TaxID=3364563 RepID=UPI0036876FF1